MVARAALGCLAYASGMSAKTDVVVVGAGLFGLATAHALAVRGHRVVLVDKRGLCAGDSGQTFGMVRRHYTNAVLIDLAMRGSETIFDWSDQVGRGGAGFVETGYLLPVPERLAETCRRQVEVGRSRGLDTRYVGPDEIARIEPLMSLDGIAGAAYEPESGFAEVRMMTSSWLYEATRRGLDARFGVDVRGLVVEDGRIAGVDTSAGVIRSDHVVLATGSWSRPILAAIGFDAPIELRRLQVSRLRQEPGAPRPNAVVSDAVTNVVVRPAGGRDFLCVAYHGAEVIDDRDACDEGVDPTYEGIVRGALGERFPALAGADWLGGFSGAYDCTPDWHPLVGETPGVAGLWLTIGWSGHGFKSSPSTGRCLAALISGDQPEVDISPLDPGRFARGELLPLAYGPGARA